MIFHCYAGAKDKSLGHYVKNGCLTNQQGTSPSLDQVLRESMPVNQQISLGNSHLFFVPHSHKCPTENT